MNDVGSRHATKRFGVVYAFQSPLTWFARSRAKPHRWLARSMEVVAVSHLEVVDDFQSFVKEDRMFWKGRQDKG